MKKKIMSALMAVSLAASMVCPAFAQETVKGGEISIATVSSTGGLDPAGFALDMWVEYAKQLTL